MKKNVMDPETVDKICGHLGAISRKWTGLPAGRSVAIQWTDLKLS